VSGTSHRSKRRAKSARGNAGASGRGAEARRTTGGDVLPLTRRPAGEEFHRQGQVFRRGRERPVREREEAPRCRQPQAHRALRTRVARKQPLPQRQTKNRREEIANEKIASTTSIVHLNFNHGSKSDDE